MHKRILITGGLGHIGSLLMRRLPDAKEIVVVDDLSTQRYCSLFQRPNNVSFIKADFAEVTQEVAKADAIVHLAATTDAAGSFDKAKEVWENNTQKTMELAYQCENNKPFIFLSTTSVYGRGKEVMVEGEDNLDPQSPYAEAKLASEQILRDADMQGHINHTILRFGTIVGRSPGIRFHTAVNAFCFAVATGQPLSVWREMFDQVRPYLTIEDAMQALRLVLRTSSMQGNTYNVVSENTSVRQITDYIGSLMPNMHIDFVDTPVLNQNSYNVSSDKIQEVGFASNSSIYEEIAETLCLLGVLTKSS